MKKSRHSEEKVIAAVKQKEGGRKTADVARELGVSAATLYAWKGKYGGMQVSEANSARSPRWCGDRRAWYSACNYDARVPRASFYEDGSQGPPCDPNISLYLQTLNHRTREASAARLRSSGVSGK